MRGSNFLIIFFSCLGFIFAGIILFELGMHQSNEYYINQIAILKNNHVDELNQTKQEDSEMVSATISEEDALIADKDDQIQSLTTNKDQLSTQVTELSGQVAGLSIDNSSAYPFAVPTTGTIGSQVSTYFDHTDGTHYGVDIWTNTENEGAISTHKGNPVYSACSGIVESFQPENGGVTISCDTISSTYDVPAHKVYTYYGHMANAITKEQYTVLKSYGQRVRKGQFIGFQGDLSMVTPAMRNIHLHFSVFTGSSESEGNQDPCKYIGGECQKVGSFFVGDMK